MTAAGNAGRLRDGRRGASTVSVSAGEGGAVQLLIDTPSTLAEAAAATPQGSLQRVVTGDEGLLVQQSSSLIGVTSFRSDPQFAGINGAGTSIVIIDTGADLDHPAFGPDSDGNGVADRIVYQYDFSGENDGNAGDTIGHGTNVAGIAASSSSTYTGMAPGASIIVLKVFADNSSSAFYTDINEALAWVVANRTAYNVVSVNLSLGSGNTNTSGPSVASANFAALAGAGVAVVAAAGNSFYNYFSIPGVSTLAADPNAWAVSAVYDADVGARYWNNGAIDYSTGADRVTSFSQRSATLTDIMAPGSEITNAYLGGGWATYSGTSMAAPHIAGIVALAQSLAERVSFGAAHVPVASLLSIMRASAVAINDGDNENDNVFNTGASLPRVSVPGLMQGVLDYFKTATNGADGVYGWHGNDTLSGLGGNDLIRGNTGNDTIDGGAGFDTAAFSGLRSAYTLTPLGGNSLQVVGPDGTDTLSNVERLAFSNMTVNWPLTPPDLPTPNDLDADGNSDIVWRSSDGRVGLWQMGGHRAEWGGAIAMVDNAWQVDSTGDFNNDDRIDLLWRNARDGRVGLWEMNGQTIAWAGSIGTVDSSWHIADAADFSGDGTADILWRNASDGRVGIWEVSSRAVAWAGAIATIDLGWQIAAADDFNGDGKADILLRDMRDGRVGLWEMDGHAVAWGGAVGTIDLGWQIAGTGDFNGDDKADILLRDTRDGRVGLWEMDGNVVVWAGAFATVDLSWQIAETGDFNAAGMADILWRCADGRVGVWEMDGYSPMWTGSIASVDQSWHIV